MHNRTISDLLFDAKDELLSVCSERCWELLATVLFVALIPWGRKFWISFLNLLTFFEGMAFIIFPGKAISPFIVEESEGELDSLHLELIQGTGLLMVMWGISYWLVSRSTDSTVVTSFLWTQAIMTTCMVMSQGYELTHPIKDGLKFKSKTMALAFYSTGLCMLGTYYYALKSNDWGGYGEVSCRPNFHRRIDFVLLMMKGILMFSLPEWVLSSQMKSEDIDSLHEYLTRNCAIFIIGMSVIVGRAANFDRTDDKDAISFTHLLYYIFAVCMGWFRHWNDFTSSWKQAIMFSAFDLGIIFNIIGALFLFVE